MSFEMRILTFGEFIRVVLTSFVTQHEEFVKLFVERVILFYSGDCLSGNTYHIYDKNKLQQYEL